MSQRACFTALLCIALLTLACENKRAQPLSPMPAEPSGLESIAGGVEKAVTLSDACDPQTFNQALGPGSCTRNGGVTFQNFLELLGLHHSIGSWHFAPGIVTMKVGQTLVAINKGGEVHTFTEVENFGGGIVPSINQLIGETVVAPECTQLPQSAFLRPGDRSTDVEDDSGVEKYQCCIHPWMRAEIRIADK